MRRHPQTDYLVIGSGATALAFVDAMLQASDDATFTIVDRRHAPGGHWNDAYPFVKLHQPSACYGVASRPLGRGQIDTTGFNQGLAELATGSELTHYYHSLMREVLLPSGRVNYHPLSEYTPQGEIVQLLSGERQRVDVGKKLVDATLTESCIPLTHRRKFGTDEGVTCVPPNELVRLAPHHRHFAVLGAGKTALDSVSFLLSHGVAASSITWVVPRDPFLWNRRCVQTLPVLFPQTVRHLADQFEIYATSASIDTLADRLQTAGIWFRLDAKVQATMQHGATVTELELEHLRRIDHIVRFGRVEHIERERLRLERGNLPMPKATLYVDCTASALARNVGNATAVFAPGKISLQMVRLYQPTFSAALIGNLEATISDEATKATLLEPVPMTDTLADFVRSQSASLRNQIRLARHPHVRAWITTCRLDPYAKQFEAISPEDIELLAITARFRKAVGPALENLQKLC